MTGSQRREVRGEGLYEYVWPSDDSLQLEKKVLRQTTLPSVPTRHQTFQRQLSHRLDLNNIQFSICSLEHRNDFSIGLIKKRRAAEDSGGGYGGGGSFKGAFAFLLWWTGFSFPSIA
uniref:Uncharacterized protein n=1 Tax=Timema douglasi TaxID=61478 RepID=A0A7R8Z900_TIMDO|nr:unnamed protein product [Timema douglasi]